MAMLLSLITTAIDYVQIFKEVPFFDYAQIFKEVPCFENLHIVYCRGSLPVVHVPLGVYCLSEGVHLRLAIEGKNIFIYYLFPNVVNYKSSIKNSAFFCYFTQPFCHSKFLKRIGKMSKFLPLEKFLRMPMCSVAA